MRILFMGNNRVGWQVLDWLVKSGERIVGAVVHPEERRRYGREIEACLAEAQCPVWLGPELGSAETRSQIAELAPDIGVSVLFGYILDPEFIATMPQGCVNVHLSLLPHNRGAHPNVWSIVEGSPAGVTIHYIDKGIDTGDLIAQREVPVEPTDTGKTLYERLEGMCIDLFHETWPSLRTGLPRRIPQQGDGSYHRSRDLARIDEIDLDQAYVARDLINILRARTFPPFTGAYFRDQGRKVTLRLELAYEDD